MIKHLTLALCISLPLAAMAGDTNKDRKKDQGDKKPVVEATVPATTGDTQTAVTNHNVRKVEITRQQSRRSAMGFCMKAGTDQGLTGPELKQSIGECMKTR